MAGPSPAAEAAPRRGRPAVVVVVVALTLSGCRDAVDAPPGARPLPTPTTTSQPEGSASLSVDVDRGAGWVDDDERQAWDTEHGPGTWVVGYFLPPDYDHDTFHEDVLVRRWQRIADDDRDLDRSALLAEALAALPGAAPDRLGNSWQKYPNSPERELDLDSARVEGHEVVLDFSNLEAGAPGTTAAMVMGMQFDAVVGHYYPDAEGTCVLVRGEPSFWLHDMLTCPSRQS